VSHRLKLHPWWLIIPAAGFGERMGAARPKQYLTLDSRSVLEVTLSRFIGLPGLQGAVVALAPDDALAPSLLANFKEFPLHFAVGGATRSASVRALLHYLQQQGVDERTLVLVHDAARPCVRKVDIEALLACAFAAKAGALLATPVRDTLKQADANHTVQATVPRAGVYHALTPQAFVCGLLIQALDFAEQAGCATTDDSSAVELMGKAPHLVVGHADNIKITHPDDLPLARLILQAQGQWRPGLAPLEG
jgi:2-C-methyl-D-erythritol 4-phosphate cytidylyltransferase